MEGCEPEKESCGPVDQASPWSPFVAWEDQCLREAEEFDRQFHSELEAKNHRLWINFQSSACSIAQLFKGKLNIPMLENGV